MCLAIPAQVVLISENRIAQVDIHGVQRTASLDLVPDAEVDSWVLVHAGFAIQVVDEQFAAESWELIKELADAVEDEELRALTSQGAAPAGTGAKTAP
jgi:hydrogenase expression/formation protein HypC